MLSRGVAGPENVSASPLSSPALTPTSRTVKATIHSDPEKTIVTLGEAASPSALIRLSGNSEGQLNNFNVARTGSRASLKLSSTPSRDFSSYIACDEHQQVESSPCPIPTVEPSKITQTYVSEYSQVVENVDANEVARAWSLEEERGFPNSLPRIETRFGANDGAINLDVRRTEKRLGRSSTFFDDPTDPCAIFEDNLLEPLPRIPFSCSVSEVLKDCPQSSSSVSSLPYIRPSQVLRSGFDNLEYVATKCLSSGENTQGISNFERSVLKSRVSAASQIPTEIIQQIYYNLAPADFNSARHTCRSWYISSLECSVLETMLGRGGWSTSGLRKMKANHVLDSEHTVNDEWLLSKRVARECALGPDWTGNGLLGNKDDPSVPTTKSALVHTCTINFTDIAVHHSQTKSAGIIFTVSSCGRFVMAAHGCLIYVYELNRNSNATVDLAIQAGSLRPVTSIICPHRVLACSMDTSSHRYAIAALLDGRIGLVCDISARNIAARTISRDKPGNSNSGKYPDSSLGASEGAYDFTRHLGPLFVDRVSLNSSASHLASGRQRGEPPFGFTGTASTRTCSSPPQSESWRDEFWGGCVSKPVYKSESSSRNPLPSSPCGGSKATSKSDTHGQLEKESYSKGIPIEKGHRSLYRNLCSDDDPPRSVAICPQRRCVAFGCSAGIELHWVDALTGQDLNRWFPLTAPSDFLFFLPPRRSVDSAKKLRLISSAARPSERAALFERAFGRKFRSSPFWDMIGSGVSQLEDGDARDERQSIRLRLNIAIGAGCISERMDCSDHYRAVPLSDGYHILFTDPVTGVLCLGSDAPIGSPTKLLRKIWFQGPNGKGSPVAYASGSDLSCGVRVIAAFGSGEAQSIWLFSVPSDVFAASQSSRPLSVGASWLRASSNRGTRNKEWIDWGADDGLKQSLNHPHDLMPRMLRGSVWPVKIRGQEIGMIHGLVDLAIDSCAHMTVWAFSKRGFAKVWQMDDGRYTGVKKILVDRDGSVRDEDGDGDVEMLDAGSSSESISEALPPTKQESFDGTASTSSFDALWNSNASTRTCGKHQTIEGSQSTATYDSDGDVLMDDLPSLVLCRGESISEDSIEVGLLLHNRGEIEHRPSRWLGRSPICDGADFVEALTGIARMDIEIQ